MQHNRNSSIKFAAILGFALLGFAALAGSDAQAQAQTATGFEYSAEQTAAFQLGSRHGAESNYLVACDSTALGGGSRVGASALCAVRVYDGLPGDWQGYRLTYRMTCTEAQGCTIGGAE